MIKRPEKTSHSIFPMEKKQSAVEMNMTVSTKEAVSVCLMIRRRDFLKLAR